MSLFLHFLQRPVLDLPHPGLSGLQLVRAERFVGQDPDHLTTRSQQQTRIKQTIDKFLVRCKKNCKLPQGPFRRGWPQLPWRRERNERAAGTSPSPCWWQQKMNKDEKLDILTFVGPSQWSAWKHLEEAPEIKRLCWQKTFWGDITLLPNSTNHYLMTLWFGSPFVEFSVLQMLWISGLTPSGMSRKGSLLGNLLDKSIFAKLSF